MSVKSLLRGVYDHSPYFIKSLMANVYGRQRHAWRYNEKTQELVDQAAERDSWSDEQWKKYTDNRIEFILNRAATKVPYYKEYWQARRKAGDNSSAAYIENWPILTKETVRQNSLAFLA